MRLNLANFVKFTVSGTPGTGDFTIDAATTGNRLPAAAGVANNDLVPYVAKEGNSIERGIATYSSTGPKFVRTKIIESTNSNAAVNFTSAVSVYIGASSAELDQTLLATNGESSAAIVIGAPVYVSAADTVKRAKADAASTAAVVGLAYEASTSASSLGLIKPDGVLKATTTQWDAVTGGSGGLTAGSLYYLDAATAGKLTTTSPSTAGQYVVKVGRALSSTELMVFSTKDPVLVSGGTYSIEQYKTSSFTAAAGYTYFCDTTSGAITVTLPSGNTGDTIRVVDARGTFSTNNLTISGSSNVDGSNFTGASSVVLKVNGEDATLVWNGSLWDCVRNSDFSRSARFFQPPPDVTGWTWVNQGTATITQVGGAGTPALLSVPHNGSNNMRGLFTSQPSTPYSVIALMHFDSQIANTSIFSMMFRSSTGSQLMGVSTYYTSGGSTIRVEKWSNPTTFSSEVSSITINTGNAVCPVWLRLRNSGGGGTLYFDYTFDGWNFTNLFSESVGTFITPDQVGFAGYLNLPGRNARGHVMSWMTTSNTTA